MIYDVRVAVVAADLPRFEPPVGDNGWELPYGERTAVTFGVAGSETLEDIYRRAIDELAPRPIDYDGDVIGVVRWAWFYEPSDQNGISDKVWEVAEDLIVVGEDGTARWNLPASQITLEQLVRSYERGLLRGDPRRPYLVLVLPQGGEALQSAWDAILLIWQIVSQLLTARELVKLAGNLRRDRMARKLEAAREVVERNRSRWSSDGGGPAEVLRTLERQPWPLDDLRILLGLETDVEAAELLAGFGFGCNADGLYELSVDEESRILYVISQEAGWGGFGVAGSEEWTDHRLSTLLQTGELPPRVDPTEFS